MNPVLLRLLGAILLLGSLYSLSACDAGSPVIIDPPDNNNCDDEEPDCGTITGTGKTGQALLGPVVLAKVEIFDIENRESPVCESITTTSRNLSQAGLIRLDKCSIDPQTIYLVEVSGGWDIDRNDDGIEDPWVPVSGTIKAIIEGQEILDNPWRVTIVTDAISSTLLLFVDAGFPAQDLLAQLDYFAPFIVGDVNADGSVDRKDVYAWDPTKDLITDSLSDYIKKHDERLHAYATFDKAKVAADSKSQLAHLDTFNEANRALLVDQVLYVTTETSFLVIDISDPLAPVIHRSIPLIGPVLDLRKIGHSLYIAKGYFGMQHWDITDPLNPVLVEESIVPHSRLAKMGEQAIWAAETPAYGWSTTMRVITEQKSNENFVPLLKDVSSNDFFYSLVCCFSLTDPQPMIVSAFDASQDDIANTSYFSIGKVSLFFSAISIVNVRWEDNYVLYPNDNIPISAPAEVSNVYIDNLSAMQIPIQSYYDSSTQKLYAVIVSSHYANLAFTTSLRVWDLSNPANPLELQDQRIDGVRSFNLHQGKFYVWKNGYISTLEQAAAGAFPDMLVPTDTPLSSITLKEGILHFLTLSVLLNDSDLEDPYDVYIKEYFKLRKELDRVYYYPGRLQFKDDKVYVAAGRYGLLVFPLQP